MTPGELISSYRKKISHYTAIIQMGITVCIVSTLIFNLDKIFPGLWISVCLVLLALGVYFYLRYKDLQILLKGEPTEVLINLQAYLNKKQELWSKNDIVRFVIGAIMMVAMLTLLFTHSEITITGFLIVLWVTYVTGSMMHGWILMQDLMMAQDIKKCIRENHSETSD